MSTLEGVIRFESRHVHRPLSGDYDPLWVTLDRCREALFARHLIGHDGVRYGGAGWGNVSARAGQHFIISGTQTGGLTHTSGADYALVLKCDVDSLEGAVHSEGLVRPSSEAMTHAALYEASDQIRFVFHVHSPEIFRAVDVLGLPATEPGIAYGTPLMARAAARFAHTAANGLFVMRGHEDGVVAYGAEPTATLERLLRVHDAAQALWHSAG